MTKENMKIARRAITQIAHKDGVSEEYVRKQMQVAMLNGLCSSDPMIKAYWQSIPTDGEIPTPEEFIIFTAIKCR